MAGRFAVESVFRGVDKVSGPVSKMQRRVERFTRSVKRGFRSLERGTQRLVRGFRNVATSATVAMATVGLAIAAVIRTGAEFEQTIINAGARMTGVIRKGSAEFGLLEDAARKLGATTEFTATQAAGAINVLAVAGFDAREAIASLTPILDLATVAQVDLATATSISTDMLGALGLRTSNVAQQQKNLIRITDVLAKTSTSANFTIEELFESMKQGAPIGTAAGQSLETIATLAATMADAGIKGSKAGTALKRVFLALNAPTSEGAKMMRRLGIATADSNGNIRNAIDVLADLGKAIQKLPEQSKISAMEQIFGKIPLAGALSIVNAGASMRVLEQTLKDAAGTAELLARVMRDSTRTSLLLVVSAVEAVALSMFTMFEGPLNDVIKGTREWILANEQLLAQNFGQFFSDILENLPLIAQTASDIAIGFAAIVALNIGLQLVAATLGVINLLMLANPIVQGVVLAIAAVALLTRAFDPVVEVILRISKGIAAIIRTGSGISGAFKGLFGGTVSPTTVQEAAAFQSSIFGGITGGSTEPGEGTVRQIVSPQARLAQTISENNTTVQHQVEIITPSGTTAEVKKSPPNSGLVLQPSGGT